MAAIRLDASCKGLATPGSALQVQHARHQLQAVLDPVVDLFDQYLLVCERFLKFPFLCLPLDGHAQNIGRALQERDVVLAEFTLGPAVYFQDTIWNAIALQNHIHGAAHAVAG